MAVFAATGLTANNWTVASKAPVVACALAFCFIGWQTLAVLRPHDSDYRPGIHTLAKPLDSYEADALTKWVGHAYSSPYQFNAPVMHQVAVQVAQGAFGLFTLGVALAAVFITVAV